MWLSRALAGRWEVEVHFFERTAANEAAGTPTEGISGYLVEELELVRWLVGQRLGLLSRNPSSSTGLRT